MIAIVQQEVIGERVEARPGVLIAAHDGFFAHVAAGHDQGIERLVEEQMVERGIRQHEAEARVSGSDTRGDSRLFAARQENDGPAGSLEQCAIRIGQNADPFGNFGTCGP